MHPEQAAFEKAIDDNPLDANNHLVYADWLDEHNQPDEAAFRRRFSDILAKHGRHDTNMYQPYRISHQAPFTTLVEASIRHKNRNRTTFHSPMDSYSGYIWSTEYRPLEEEFRKAFLASRKHLMHRNRSFAKRYCRSR